MFERSIFNDAGQRVISTTTHRDIREQETYGLLTIFMTDQNAVVLLDEPRVDQLIRDLQLVKDDIRRARQVPG